MSARISFKPQQFLNNIDDEQVDLYVAVQGICWAKMFHLRVDVVEPRVCVNEIVSVEVAPNSTYTGKVKVSESDLADFGNVSIIKEMYSLSVHEEWYLLW